MNNEFEELAHRFETYCADGKIVTNIKNHIMSEAAGEPDVELEIDDQHFYFNADSKLSVLSKAFFIEEEDIQFGTFKVFLVCGDYRVSGGIYETDGFFILCYLEKDLEVISVDLSSEFM